MASLLKHLCTMPEGHRPRALLPAYAVPPALELWRRLKEQTRALVDAITQSGILLPATFVFLWQAGLPTHAVNAHLGIWEVDTLMYHIST